MLSLGTAERAPPIPESRAKRKSLEFMRKQLTISESIRQVASTPPNQLIRTHTNPFSDAWDYPETMPISRRTLLASVPAALAAQPANRLSRRELVSRHNPTLHALDPRSPLSVGNGEFAFTVDPTGLQTFPQPYDRQMPLCTQSQWGWHTAPNTTGKTAADLRLEDYDTFGRKVGYPTSSTGQKPLFDWLRENPHRLHLGRIGFVPSNPSAVRYLAPDPRSLDRRHPLRVRIPGRPHRRRNLLPPLPGRRRRPHTGPPSRPLRVPLRLVRHECRRLRPPRKAPHHAGGRHAQQPRPPSPARRRYLRRHHRLARHPRRNQTRWRASLPPHPEVRPPRLHLRLHPLGLPQTAVARRHLRTRRQTLGELLELRRRARTYRAPIREPRELERRIVLSQYLTAIQCAGSMPPQETGLTCNSWYGKFHLEMHYWHAAHFAAWGRPALLERSLAWYNAILPSAAREGPTAGLRRRALAQNDRARRPRQPVATSVPC